MPWWHKVCLRSPLSTASVLTLALWFSEEKKFSWYSFPKVTLTGPRVKLSWVTHCWHIHRHTQTPGEQWQAEMPSVWPGSIAAMQKVSDSFTELCRIMAGSLSDTHPIESTDLHTAEKHTSTTTHAEMWGTTVVYATHLHVTVTGWWRPFKDANV